jgi:hypothetical protein
MLIGARWQAPVARSTLQPVKPARAPDDTGLRAFSSVSGAAQRERRRSYVRAGESETDLCEFSCLRLYNFM